MTLHRYGYVGDNPVNYLDANGFSRVPSRSSSIVGPMCVAPTIVPPKPTPVPTPTPMSKCQSDSNLADFGSNIFSWIHKGISIMKFFGIAEIDLRFSPLSKVMPRPFWLKYLPSTTQKQIVQFSRAALSKIPYGSKLASLGAQVNKASPLLTFIVSPFIELPASIKMIEKRIGGVELTTPERVTYSFVASLDAASFGIARGGLKTFLLPLPLISTEKADSSSAWIDENVNAGATADLLIGVGTWVMSDDIPYESAQLRR